jgi:N-sulfoglucosamine sulfohydrolase
LDSKHFISGIDFFPTVLEATGVPTPNGMDGASFLPLLLDRAQSGRSRVFTQIDMKAGGDAIPMRCVQDHRFGYIFNPWSDGTFYYRNNNEGLTMKAMVEAAKTDSDVAQRVTMFRSRAVEELYDLQKDPDCLRNLIDKPDNQAEVDAMRRHLQDWMKQTRDPLLATFQSRHSPAQMKACLVDLYGENYEKAARWRPGQRRRKKNRKKPDM